MTKAKLIPLRVMYGFDMSSLREVVRVDTKHSKPLEDGILWSSWQMVQGPLLRKRVPVFIATVALPHARKKRSTVRTERLIREAITKCTRAIAREMGVPSHRFASPPLRVAA